MRGLAIVTVLLAAALSIQLAGNRSAHAARSQTGPTFFDLGDSFQVRGASLGCKVVARDGGKAVDCRISGPLTGSYGTLMTDTHLLVVRFRSAQVAKVVFDARQRHGFTTCH